MIRAHLGAVDHGTLPRLAYEGAAAQLVPIAVSERCPCVPTAYLHQLLVARAFPRLGVRPDKQTIRGCARTHMLARTYMLTYMRRHVRACPPVCVHTCVPAWVRVCKLLVAMRTRKDCGREANVLVAVLSAGGMVQMPRQKPGESL